MEKVVVPKFVADYIQENYQGLKPSDYDKADLIRTLCNYNEDYGHTDIKEWVKNESNFLTLITAIITNDYEIEEKKYYWRKKKEYMFSFEDDHYIYVNINKKTQQVHFHNKVESEFIRTVLSETEVKQLVSEEDFNKLEKVEITE